MGVRLYPMTNNSANLEKLAGVMPGTTEKLNELRKKHQIDDPKATFWENQDRYKNFYDDKTKDADIHNLDTFLLFGWGKFKFPPIMKDQEMSYSGHISDPIIIKQLFDYNGIVADVHICEGVCWN